MSQITLDQLAVDLEDSTLPLVPHALVPPDTVRFKLLGADNKVTDTGNPQKREIEYPWGFNKGEFDFEAPSNTVLCMIFVHLLV
jgi:hypothetical protein